ncbi:ABC transporter ATP-binding protein [Nocardioides sp.]|uniref:ABC transporter ATP-binding protein n=1 Tax=Nocardioides sp. TaxID=35761 RepID=UPI0039E41A8C
MTGTVLEVSGLRKEFVIDVPGKGKAHTLVAVDDVSFSVSAGGALAVVGESGSGKTTVARMIAGLEQATAGHVYVDGVERTRPRGAAQRLAQARQVQMVFQDPYSSLDPRQTVSSCLDEVLRLHHGGSAAERAARIHELMSQVGLDERHEGLRPKALSGGQRQRVGIARALAVKPSLLILDESVAALDVSIQAQILNLLNSLREELGVAYLFVTHNLAVARYVCETTLVMRRGQMVEYGTSDKVLRDPAADYTRRLLEAVPHVDWVPRRRTAEEMDG